MNGSTRQFINEHRHDDIRQLALQASRYPDVDMPLALQQITGYRKMLPKVPLLAQAEGILYPVRLSLEQSSSEITARYKSSLFSGKNFADLTGGFGIDTYFISQRFDKAVYVERQPELCRLAKHNFAVLNAGNINVVNSTTEEYLQTATDFDLIYLDPARRDDAGKKLVLLSDCEPNVINLAPELMQKARTVMVKLSPMLDISAAINQLPHISEIHILAVDNDCKEILLVLAQDKKNDTLIKTINFKKDGCRQYFSYYSDEEPGAVCKFASEIKGYLYEPNVAVMKSGAFKLISQKLAVEKLHLHTHLYTSDMLIADFPGRVFKVLNVWGNSKSEWKKHLSGISKANITVRNYPVKVEELRKKLKLSEGGDCYLFACTLSNNEKTIIECKKI